MGLAFLAFGENMTMRCIFGKLEVVQALAAVAALVTQGAGSEMVREVFFRQGPSLTFSPSSVRDSGSETGALFWHSTDWPC